MYRSSGGFFLIISALGAIIGIALMATEKRWKVVAGIIASYIAYYYIFVAIQSIPSPHVKLLIAIPFVLFTIVPLLISGLFIWDAATDKDAFNKRWQDFRNAKIDLVKRRRGIWQLLFGLAAWLCWAFNPGFTNSETVIIIMLWAYPTIFGLQNFFTKQKNNKSIKG